MIIDIEPSDPGRLSRPEITLPTADPNKAEIVELDVAVMALADVPEQHRFTKAVIRRLGKGARAWNCAAAVVEPVADDVPARNVAHPALRSDAMAKTIAGFGDAVRALQSWPTPELGKHDVGEDLPRDTSVIDRTP